MCALFYYGVAMHFTTLKKINVIKKKKKLLRVGKGRKQAKNGTIIYHDALISFVV